MSRILQFLQINITFLFVKMRGRVLTGVGYKDFVGSFNCNFQVGMELHVAGLL